MEDWFELLRFHLHFDILPLSTNLDRVLVSIIEEREHGIWDTCILD